MKYQLIAQNKQGAIVIVSAETIKGCINRFDSEYSRKGFKIRIQQEDSLIKTIKKTYN